MLFLTKIQFPAPTAVLVIRVPLKDKAFEAISFDMTPASSWLMKVMIPKFDPRIGNTSSEYDYLK